jgi:hypothetical protein
MGVLSVDAVNYFQCGSCLELIILCTVYFRGWTICSLKQCLVSPAFGNLIEVQDFKSLHRCSHSYGRSFFSQYRLDRGFRPCDTNAQRFPWHAAFTAVLFFKFIFTNSASLYCEETVYVYPHIWLRKHCVWITVATKCCCEWNIFIQIGSGAKCSLDIYHVRDRPGGDWANTRH